MNSINWFEIPCSDLDRAVRFYESALGIALKREVFMGVPHGVFQSSKTGGVGGALVQERTNAPSAQGTRVYLNVNGQLDAVLARVATCGGEVVVPRTEIGAMGATAILRDTEGNLVGLHSR